MRILFLINIGATLFNFRKELVNALLENGHEIFISSARSNKLDYFENIGCQILEAPLEQHGMNPAKDLKLLLHYRRLIRRLKPDVVLTFTQKPNIYGAYVCRKLKVPCIATITGLGTGVHDSHWLLRKFILSLYRIAFRRISLVFFQNQGNYELMKNKKIVGDNIKMISGSGVNLDHFAFEPYPVDDGTIRILFVGRMLRDKGTEEFFECIRRVMPKHPNCRFEFLGWTSEKYESMARDLEAQGLLTIYPPTNDVRSFVKETHAVLLPTYHEGRANVLMEAAATGRVVLASQIPGCRESFDEGISGFGFLPKNVDDLCRAVEKFILLPYVEKEAMGRAGREKMENECDRRLVIDAYLNAVKNQSSRFGPK